MSGVCDAAYRIVANISVSDLRGIKPEYVDRLALPVAEFLRRQRGDNATLTGGAAGGSGGGGGGVGVDLEAWAFIHTHHHMERNPP